MRTMLFDAHKSSCKTVDTDESGTLMSPGQRSELEGLVRNGSTPQKVALRCRLLLLAHEGVANQSIAEQLSLSRPTVLALRDAFEKNGVAAVTAFAGESVPAVS